MGRFEKNILITGGAGFIGCHVIRWFIEKYPSYNIINLDKLTYAGNLENLTSVEDKPNYTFIKEDIVNAKAIGEVFSDHNIDAVIHLAAESHVDRSILNPSDFIEANIVGTFNLLNAAKEHWKDKAEGSNLFYQVSTDEVYGSLDYEGFFTENTAYDPHSPYSASKASADHLARAYFHTYGLPIVISNCSNNYGPNQFPEKLIPLMINNLIHRKALPVYGKGENIRDWLFVTDHASAIDIIFHKGKLGETYNVGGNKDWKTKEWNNLELVKLICRVYDKITGNTSDPSENLIEMVTDRPGHDFRYAIDPTKLQKELGWVPSFSFEDGLNETIQWYLDNTEWLQNVTSGTYKKYYELQYKQRSAQ